VYFVSKGRSDWCRKLELADSAVLAASSEPNTLQNWQRSGRVFRNLAGLTLKTQTRLQSGGELQLDRSCKNPEIMGAITHSIEVNAPLQAVYNQWTRFEEFPRFMGGVNEVRPDGPKKLFWRAKIGGKEKQWEAEITEQVPNERIAWQSVEGAPNRGAVTFEQVDISLTRVTLKMEYDPEGFFEQAGDALGIPLGQVAEDLSRFRDIMEKRGEIDAWSGQIERLAMPGPTEQSIREGDALSVEKSTEPKSKSENQESPEIVVSKTIVTGNEGIGSDRIAARGDESSHKEEHGTEVASRQETMADKRSGLAEDLEIGDAAPTHEQIARRAYEIYLKRGEKPGSQHEDWLAAEKELSEKSRDNRPI